MMYTPETLVKIKADLTPDQLGRIYRDHHRGSRFKGQLLRVLIRPSPKRKPNNVLIQYVTTGELAVCPFRGLRRVK